MSAMLAGYFSYDIIRFKEKIPNIRLVFMGGKHPNPDVPVNKIVQKSIDLATSFNLLNKNHIFNK